VIGKPLPDVKHFSRVPVPDPRCGIVR
jgi:hypothetical protein